MCFQYFINLLYLFYWICFSAVYVLTFAPQNRYDDLEPHVNHWLNQTLDNGIKIVFFS